MRDGFPIDDPEEPSVPLKAWRVYRADSKGREIGECEGSYGTAAEAAQHKYRNDRHYSIRYGQEKFAHWELLEKIGNGELR